MMKYIFVHTEYLHVYRMFPVLTPFLDYFFMSTLYFNVYNNSSSDAVKRHIFRQEFGRVTY